MRLLLGLALGLSAATLATATAAAAKSAGAPTLQQQKLQAEIRQLELSNRDHQGFRGLVSAYGGVLTGLAAVLGALGALWKYSRDQRRQRSLDREDQRKEEERLRLDASRRIDERFASILADLGSDHPLARLGAAVRLWTFISPEYWEYHRQVRLISLAHLKLGQQDETARQLIHVFAAAAKMSALVDGVDRDLAGAYLEGAELAGLDLRGVDLRETDLNGADLTNAQLANARGIGVKLAGTRACGSSANLETVRFQEAKATGAVFREARLVNAHFEKATLTNAQFHRTKLQGAHFEGADLRGAAFEQADLGDTRFTGATLDETALRSILRAERWRGAWFSPEHKAWLLATSRG